MAAEKQQIAIAKKLPRVLLNFWKTVDRAFDEVEPSNWKAEMVEMKKLSRIMMAHRTESVLGIARFLVDLEANQRRRIRARGRKK
jgi:hypothetical protein